MAVFTGSVTVFSTVPENVVSGDGVIVAVDVTSAVEVVVVVDVTGRVISVAVATSVVMVVGGGLPSVPSRLARARASWETESRPRRRRRAIRGTVLVVAVWSALAERVAVVQEGVDVLVMMEVLATVMTVWEVRRVNRVVVIVNIL